MWLTAWMVSYMTPRLARAALSHLPSTFSGRARMRLPSGFADGADDGGRQFEVLAGDEVDLVGEGGGRRRVGAAGAEDEDGLADANLIAGLKQHVLDALTVDESAVGAADVAEAIAFGSADELGVAARRLGVVEADFVGGVAAGGEAVAGQLELFAFVGALDDDQARHGVSSRFEEGGKPRPY